MCQPAPTNLPGLSVFAIKLQTRVFYPGYEETIEVDKDKAPLLKAVWSTRITTCNSCEENGPGTMWIEFYSAEDAEELVTRLVVAMGAEALPNPCSDAPGSGPYAVVFTVSVRFQVADCPRVLELLSCYER